MAFFRDIFQRERPRLRGLPTSGNGASSMHLRWVLPHSNAPVVEASVSLTIVDPPTVDRLYFWALQGSFEETGHRYGGAHLGLQWHPGYPGHTAANWGGYQAGGGELAGSAARRPSALRNVNTRDFHWVPGRPYRLTIRHAPDGTGWAGIVDGEILRVLYVGGVSLTGLMVWSEVFARCDDPSVTVRWSDFEAVTLTGTHLQPLSVTTSYQRRADGGCDNTTAVADGPAVLQVTNAERQVPPGRAIVLG